MLSTAIRNSQMQRIDITTRSRNQIPQKKVSMVTISHYFYYLGLLLLSVGI